MTPGPWTISEEAAAARDKAVLDQAVAVVRRSCAPDAPDDTIAFHLARAGFGAAELRRIGPALMQAVRSTSA